MNIVLNNSERVHLPEDQGSLISLVVPSANVHKIEYEKRLHIDFEATTYHAERVKVLHKETESIVRKVVSPWQFPAYCNLKVQNLEIYFRHGTTDRISTLSTGVCHVIGLIDLTLKLQDQKIPFVLIHPESGLHPSIALRLTDVLIELAWRGGDEQLRFEMLARKAEVKF